MASAALHGMLIALLLVATPVREAAEQQDAPSFAVNFVDAGQPEPSPQAPSAQPEIRLDDSDAAPPPPQQEQPTEALPQPRPRPAPHYGSALRPRASRNPFANVVPFDLSPRAERPLASSSNGRSLDLSAGPIVTNGQLHDSVVHVRGSHGAADWGEELREFVEQHKYYPQAAADNGEQGSAVLRVTVGRDGTVRKLVLVSSSGSHLLDAAWMAVFRDNRLPPFNDDMTGDQITFNYELDYNLIYQH